MRFALAIAGSVLLVVAGFLLVLANPGSDYALLGWGFVGFGVLTLIVNLVLRSRVG